MSEVLPFARSFGDQVYIDTPTARAIANVLQTSMDRPDIGIGLIVGTPGLGKTMALRIFAKDNHAALCTMSPLTATANAGMLHVSNTLAERVRGGAGLYGPAFRKFQECGMAQRFKQANLDDRALLMIDEAQSMSFELIESLRHVYDTTGIGLVLVGNPLFKSRTREAPFAQLSSRLGAQLVMDGPMEGDIAAVCAHYKIAGARQLRQLEKLAQNGGGLRTAIKVIRQADQIAKAGRTIEPHHIDAVAQMLSLA